MKKKIIIIALLLLIVSGCTLCKSSSEPKLLFTIASKDNMQGLVVHHQHFYIGFDRGDQGEIREYSSNGSLMKKSGLLDIGHTASLAYREKGNLIYEANGGKNNPATVHVVNMNRGRVVKTYDFSKFGHSALIAIDHRHDEFLLHTTIHHLGRVLFTFFSFDGSEKRQFSLPYQGVPQGLSIQNGEIDYYTDNQIMILNLKGQIRTVIHLKKFTWVKSFIGL